MKERRIESMNDMDTLKSVRRSIRELNERVDRLEERLSLQYPDISSRLAGMGLRMKSRNGKKGLLFPVDAPPEVQDDFFLLSNRYSFRLFCKDMVNNKEQFNAETLTRYCDPSTAEKYLLTLEKMNIIEPVKNDKTSFKLKNPHVESYGPTLEWFVSEIYRREFKAESHYGLRIEGTTAGGDFDVLSHLNGMLIYTEIKSCPPKYIEEGMIEAFLGRIEDLSPDFVAYYVDTRLKMSPKIIPIFEKLLNDRTRKARTSNIHRVRPVKGELFHIVPHLYIANAHPTIATQIRRALRHYYGLSKVGCCTFDRDYS